MKILFVLIWLPSLEGLVFWSNIKLRINFGQPIKIESWRQCMPHIKSSVWKNIIYFDVCSFQKLWYTFSYKTLFSIYNSQNTAFKLHYMGQSDFEGYTIISTETYFLSLISSWCLLALDYQKWIFRMQEKRTDMTAVFFCFLSEWASHFLYFLIQNCIQHISNTCIKV